MADNSQSASADLLKLTAQIVSAHVASNTVAAEALPDLIARVHGALANAGTEPQPEPVEQQAPAVPIKKSIQPDYLICLEDGAKVTMLKRYLRRRFGLEPDEYRAKWGLSADYPMVAPNYAARRSTLAKELGLGRKRAAPPIVSEEVDLHDEVPEADEKLYPADMQDEQPRHTAASVFANFGKGDEPEAEPEAAPAPAKAGAKRGRKPFSQQSMRPTRTRRTPAAS